VSKEKWYQAGLSFECTQCGNCCSGPPGYVWVTRKDIEAIARFVGLEDGKLDARYLRRVGLRHSLTERPGGDCIFLKRADGKSMCSIYPVRPLQCRTWPFWTENLSSPDAWNRAHLTCPGMNRGQPYDFVSIEDIRLRKPE
jgi:Fe-S-cluster containining protein